MSKRGFNAPGNLNTLLMHNHAPVRPILSNNKRRHNLHSNARGITNTITLTVKLGRSGTHVRTRCHRLITSQSVLVSTIHQIIPHTSLANSPIHHLPNRTSFIFPNIANRTLLISLSTHNVTTSSNSTYTVKHRRVPTALLTVNLRPSITGSTLHVAFHEPLTHRRVRQIDLTLRRSCTNLAQH